MASLPSAIHVRAGKTSRPLHAVDGVIVDAVSSGLYWRGLRLESGWSGPWGGEEVVADGHIVSMYPGDTPMPIEVRDGLGGGWVSGFQRRGQFMICPEGQPMAIRHRQHTSWTCAIVDAAFLDAVVGTPTRMDLDWAVVDPLLEHLFRALMAEMSAPGKRDDVAAALVRSFVLALGSRHGQPAGRGAESARLDARRLKQAIGWVANNLEAQFTVADMAAWIDMPATAFAREFRRLTGRTPWAYVVSARLDRARLLLGRGEAVVAVAAECGFYDQAHLTRLFKRRFGQTPAAFARWCRA